MSTETTTTAPVTTEAPQAAATPAATPTGEATATTQTTTEQPSGSSTNNQTGPQATAPVSTVAPKPFDIPTEQVKNPFEGLSESDFAKNFRGDKKALLKELYQLDDTTIGALDYRQKTGSWDDYLRVKTTDWTKVPPEKLIAEKLREQYSRSNLSEDKIQKLVQGELRNKYKMGEEHDSESDDVQLARIQLEYDAEQYRAGKIQEQSQFKAPETSPNQQAEATKTLSREEQLQESRAEILKDTAVQQFLTEKKLTYGDAQSPYNFEFKDPEASLSLVYDQQRWAYELFQKNEQGQVLLDKSGVPIIDQAKALRVAAYVKHMDQIEQALIAHGRTLGEKRAVEEAEAVNLNKSQGTETTQNSPWKEWASQARVVNS
jgi:hypothetical protein